MSQQKKSVFITYFLWMVGGLFGLHHFYLNRDLQAFVYWATCGGLFIGWISDLWKIPAYVKDFNEDPQYMEHLLNKIRKNPKPPLSISRFLASSAFSYLLGALVYYSFPKSYVENLGPMVNFLVSLAVATGVYVIGNIGRLKGKFSSTLLYAFGCYPLCFFGMDLLKYSPTIVAFCFSCEWRRQPVESRSIIWRLCIFFLCGTLYFLLFFCTIYFNCTLVNPEGEEIKCVIAARNFLRSPAWKEFVLAIKDLWTHYETYGWHGFQDHVLQVFDLEGHQHALKVFGITKLVPEAELNRLYRKKSREWHPDKFRDPSEKQVAKEKFIEIQQAYELLSQVKANRIKKNIEI